MGNERLIWIFLLVILCAEKSKQYSCRKSRECTCSQLLEDQWEMLCPKDASSTFIIDVRTREFATIVCFNNPSWPNLKYRSTVPMENVELFNFHSCQLPDSSLREITDKVGVRPTKKLLFDSNKKLNTSLERRHLSGFPQIETLSLDYNDLRNLPGDLLQDLPELRTLELSENNVVLPVEFFEPVPKLETLKLAQNKLTRIDSKLLRSLKQLNHLDLWYNDLTTIEERTFDKLTALSTLEISKNKLVNLPQDIFKHLKNLTNLQMNSNKFSSLPEGLLSQNQNLIKFGLSFNSGDMTSLPSRFFSNLSSLKDVQLINSGLTDIPEDIFWGSSSLRNLTLRANSLTSISKNIFNESRNLVTLDLSLNKFSTLPDELFKALNKLEKLELQDNNLTYIFRDMLVGLSGLKELNLERNKISNVDAQSFYPLSALEIVRLSHNEITFEEAVDVFIRGYGPSSPLSNCTNLRVIDLAHNKINNIFPDWYFSLLKLHFLDLSYNEIPDIEVHQLGFLSHDIAVDITHNNIRRINLNDAEPMAFVRNDSKSKHVKIFVEGNPIICDCFLYKFLNYLEDRLHPDVKKMFNLIPGRLRCAGPDHLDQILVSDLKSNTLECNYRHCPEKCKCRFRPRDKTVIADCSYRNLISAPAESFSAPNAVKIEVDLTGNKLTKVPKFNQSGEANITKLSLSYNRISSISADAVPSSLQTLELDNNNLTKLSPIVLLVFDNSRSLIKLTLHGNPWKCDCEAIKFLRFVQNNCRKISQISDVTCESNNTAVLMINTNDVCPVG